MSSIKNIILRHLGIGRPFEALSGNEIILSEKETLGARGQVNKRRELWKRE
jgi:hypothetical protein